MASSISKRPDAPSKVIAVAGASGKTGQHIVEELVSAGFSVLSLLRRAAEDLVSQFQDVARSAGQPTDLVMTAIIDYHNPSSIAETFRQYEVDTVISCLWNSDTEELKANQRALIQAANECPNVRRFAPSEWLNDSEANELMPVFFGKREAIRLLRESPLNVILFRTGMYLNYLSYGSPKLRAGEVESHLAQLPFVVNIKDATAEIVGTGDEEVVFTEAHDQGKLAAGACKLPQWREELGGMQSLTTTYNQIVKLAERTTGKKINVTYETIEAALKKAEAGQDFFASFLPRVKSAIANGDFSSKMIPPRLNEEDRKSVV